MKIIGASISGYRKISFAEMKFTEEGLIPFYGKNKVGKTSIGDFIRWMINGTKELNTDIINWDKDKLNGTLRIGDYEIQREYIAGKQPKLKVKNVVTGKYEDQEVQKFLSTFINELTMNPRPFIDKTTLEKMRFLMELLGIDFTAINEKIATAEADRLYVGRKIKEFGDLDADVPEKIGRINIEKLTGERKEIEKRNVDASSDYEIAREEELAEIEQFNKEQRQKTRVREVEEDRLSDVRKDEVFIAKEIAILEAKMKECKKQKKSAGDNIIDSLEKLQNLPGAEKEKPLTSTLPQPKLESTTMIDAQVQTANAVNVKADVYEKWLAEKKDKADQQKKYNGHGANIHKMREKKLETLRKTKTGVKGLEIRIDGLYYNNSFSENWSDSESLVIASELCISQIDRENQLEAVFLDRFESFDKDMRNDYTKWCKSKGIQAIVTIVRDSKEEIVDDGAYFWIEGGQVEFHEEKEKA